MQRVYSQCSHECTAWAEAAWCARNGRIVGARCHGATAVLWRDADDAHVKSKLMRPRIQRDDLWKKTTQKAMPGQWSKGLGDAEHEIPLVGEGSREADPRGRRNARWRVLLSCTLA